MSETTKIPVGAGRFCASLLVVAAWAAAPSIGAEPQAADAGLPASGHEGLIVPSKQVVIHAPLDAILATRDVEEGDVVEADQVIANMDDRLQRVVVELARMRSESDAEIRRMGFAAKEAKILLDRAQEARDADAASEWEVRRAQLQLDQAEATVDAAEEARKMAAAELRLEEEKLKQYRVVAPFDGRIIRVEAEAGATLTRDDPLLTLAALDPLEAHVQVAAEHYKRLKPGSNYELKAGEPVGGRLTGRLKTIDPIIDSASGTFRCVFAIDNPGSALPAGFTVWLLGLDPIERAAVGE